MGEGVGVDPAAGPALEPIVADRAAAAFCASARSPCSRSPCLNTVLAQTPA